MRAVAQSSVHARSVRPTRGGWWTWWLCGRPSLPAAVPFGARFGRSREKISRFFGLLAPNRALRRIENPRVAGSIPALATISNSMIRNGFLASPADYPWPLMADPRTIGKWVGGATPGGTGMAGWGSGDLETSRP